MSTRVLLLGSTGLTKRETGLKIQNRGNYLKRPVKIEEFENTYLPMTSTYQNMDHYLSMDLYQQAATWREAWQKFIAARQNWSPDITLLVIHGTIVDSSYGVRPSVNANLICTEYDPDLVITLIDNIYTMWWETENRATLDQTRARPSLEQLLMARRVETLVADQIATNCHRKSQAGSHLLFSKNHPIDALENLIFHNARPVYLSFPISAPRRLLRDEKLRGIGEQLVEAINEFHHAAKEFQTSNKHLAFISPLAIDELPFSEASDLALAASDLDFNFDPGHACWNIKHLWPDTELFFTRWPTRCPISTKLADDVRGIIRTDVAWRDSRLALQSRCVAVFSPAVPQVSGPSKMARGVIAEIDLAAKYDIPCFVYQDPKFDPDNAWTMWLDKPGSMGADPVQKNVTEASSIRDLFERVARRLMDKDLK